MFNNMRLLLALTEIFSSTRYQCFGHPHTFLMLDCYMAIVVLGCAIILGHIASYTHVPKRCSGEKALVSTT